MSEGSMRRRRPSSRALAAPLPDNDDLLCEILLRLPPLPSSLLRASLVSKRWLRILSDPQFLRRFRAFHHRRAPLLGFFIDVFGNLHFTPTLESFKVVVLRTDDVLLDPHAFAFLYESKAGVWSNIISTFIRAPLWLFRPSILVGNSLYWLLLGYGKSGILKFDLDRKNLTAFDTPPDAQVSNQSQILRMEDTSLSLATVTGFNIQLWAKKPNSEGGNKWMLHKTINLDKLLSLRPTDTSWIVIHGYDEDGDAIFVSADEQVFMIKLKSLQFKSLFKCHIITDYHPFTSFYATGRGLGSGDTGADILNNT